MKTLAIAVASLTFLLVLSSCSKCYECSSYSYVLDGQGNVVDSVENVDNFCSSGDEQVKQEEQNGATCKQV